MDARIFPPEVCTGMDVPRKRWDKEDVKFWTGTKYYQPWKDVAAFFRDNAKETS